MATVAEFEARYPAFRGSRTDTAAVLAEVERMVPSHWGGRRDDVIYLTMADAMATGVDGRRARKVDDGDGETIYAQRLQQMQREFSFGRRVSGLTN